MAKKSIEAQALLDYKTACDSYTQQLQREIEDLRFQVPELQWDEDARRARMGYSDTGVPVPARPTLSISKVDQPTQLVLNQFLGAQLSVNIHPLSEEADKETAEILQGLYRSVERECNANQARFWAFERGVKAGRGAYRINTVWDDEGGNPFDQKIVIERILYQDCVKFDPSATRADYSDGRFAFVTAWMPVEEFKAKYPDAEVADFDDPFTMEEVQRQVPEWVDQEGEKKFVQVAEYFRKEPAIEKVSLLDDGTVVVGPVPKGKKVVKERDRDTWVLMWYKLAPGGKDALQILESRKWNGKYIPLIPTIGRELIPFDTERRWTGIYGPAKDGQKTFNYAASTAVEITALEPKAPWVGVEGQFEGHEAQWGTANIRNYPYLQYRNVNLNGTPAPPPQRAQIDVSRLGPSMQLLQMADDFIQSTTATPDASLGRVNPKSESGRAILALQDQSNAAQSHYMANMAQISMRYEAKVILDLIPAIYDRPGRIAQILSGEDETSSVILNANFTEGEDGEPKRVEGTPDDPDGDGIPGVKKYDLRRGVYGVDIAIGKGYTSRLQEGATEIGQILSASPELMPLIGPTYFRFRDFPGSQEIAEMLKKLRDKQYPGIDSKDGIETRETLLAERDKLAQELQMLQAQMQQMAQVIETKQAEQQAKVQTAQIDAATKQQTSQMDNETRVLVEEIKAQTAKDVAEIRARVDLLLQKMEETHAVQMAAMNPPEERGERDGKEG